VPSKTNENVPLKSFNSSFSALSCDDGSEFARVLRFRDSIASNDRPGRKVEVEDVNAKPKFSLLKPVNNQHINYVIS